MPSLSLLDDRINFGHHLPQITTTEASSIVGWISIWVWVCVYSPQLQENYVLKSGEGLSIVFIYIWLAGDALNMIGAYIEGLLPTMIILAAYYCLCDVALIWQYFYYQKYHEYFHPAHSPSEASPLLPEAQTQQIRQEKPHPPTFRQEMVKCGVGLAFTTIAGIISWYITVLFKWQQQNSVVVLESNGWRWDAQAAGWASAVLYLASRIPQIFKNRQTKCEGLSLVLFVFAVMGNVTYVASIIIKSTSPDYIVENLSWLIGSSGTILLDFVVLAQFIAYRAEREELCRQRESNENTVG